jgi:hypothetical protein
MTPPRPEQDRRLARRRRSGKERMVYEVLLALVLIRKCAR